MKRPDHADGRLNRPAISSQVDELVRLIPTGWHLNEQTCADDCLRIFPQRLEARDVHTRRPLQINGKTHPRVAHTGSITTAKLTINKPLRRALGKRHTQLQCSRPITQAERSLIGQLKVIDVGVDACHGQRWVDYDVSRRVLVRKNEHIRTIWRWPISPWRKLLCRGRTAH